VSTVGVMHSLFESIRHFWDIPYVAVALTCTLLGVLDMIYALAPKRSWYGVVLKVLFWVLYPLLVVTLSSGRKARQDRDTHLIYAICILLLGLGLFTIALVFRVHH